MKKRTTIPLFVETRNQLKELGKKGETYDQIVRKLIKIAREKKNDV